MDIKGAGRITHGIEFGDGQLTVALAIDSQKTRVEGVADRALQAMAFSQSAVWPLANFPSTAGFGEMHHRREGTAEDLRPSTTSLAAVLFGSGASLNCKVKASRLVVATSSVLSLQVVVTDASALWRVRRSNVTQ